MTNFIYEREGYIKELKDAMKTSSVNNYITLMDLLDHIEAQGKQLRELNAAITKRNATIEKYERENKELQTRNSYLVKKVDELNQGIRNSEDLTWKQIYEALVQSSEQAISALQKKCKEYKNSESDAITSTIETLTKANKELEEKNKKLKENFEKLEHDYNELIKQRNTLYYENKKLERYNLDLGDTIGLYVEEFKKLKEDLEKEKQVSKDLNVIINSKNKLLDEYMAKCDNLEHNYKEEVKMKEQFKTICFRHERTIESQNSTIKYLKEIIKKHNEEQIHDTFSTASYLTKRCNKAEETLSKIRDLIDGKE